MKQEKFSLVKTFHQVQGQNSRCLNYVGFKFEQMLS